jgi:hypothetical protein
MLFGLNALKTQASYDTHRSVNAVKPSISGGRVPVNLLPQDHLLNRKANIDSRLSDRAATEDKKQNSNN